MLPEEEMKVFYEDYLGCDYTKFSLPKVAYEMRVFDTHDTNKDMNIQNDLEDCGFVWSCKPVKTIEHGNVDDECSGRRDVTVTQVIDTATFWGLLGSDSLDIVTHVQEILKSWHWRCDMSSGSRRWGALSSHVM